MQTLLGALLKEDSKPLKIGLELLTRSQPDFSGSIGLVRVQEHPFGTVLRGTIIRENRILDTEDSQVFRAVRRAFGPDPGMGNFESDRINVELGEKSRCLLGNGYEEDGNKCGEKHDLAFAVHV